MFRKYREYESFLQLIFLITLTTIVVYYVPVEINRILFLFLLIPMWRSKNDYFWFAYILILLEIPGGLFSGSGLNDPTRLPIYTFAPKISTSFIEISILLFLVKALNGNFSKIYKSFVYKKYYKYLALLFIVLLITSLLMGVSTRYFITIFRGIIVLSFFVSVIHIFKKEDDIVSFFRLIFPFSFIALFLQFYSMIYHQQLVTLFNPEISVTQGILTGEEIRPLELPEILLLCFTGSFIYFRTPGRIFSDRYLLLINIVCYLSILLTATRSWFLGLSVVYIFYFILNYKQLHKIGIKFVAPVVLIMIVISFIPQFGDQIRTASKRLGTITELASGDQTAGGTLVRLTDRSPRVIEGFKQSTIILGAGFSDLYFDYADGHVGFENILLNSGIIGMLLFISFATVLFFTPLRALRKSCPRSDLRWDCTEHAVSVFYHDIKRVHYCLP
jgi:hypothetical protein